MYVVKQESQVHFKGSNTIKDLLVATMDKDSITNQGGVIYRYRCDYLGLSTLAYIGETGRNMGADTRNI